MKSVGVSGMQEPFLLNDHKYLKRSTIGAFTYLDGTVSLRSTDVGRFCSIADGCFIGGMEHPIHFLSTHLFAYKTGDKRFKDDPTYKSIFSNEIHERAEQRTTIGNDVWIGANAVVMKGVIVGDGAIIGAGSVVTKNVEPYAIVAGVPARVIRYRFEPDLIERLLRVKWWDYHLDRQKIGDVPYSNVPAFLDRLEELIGQGEIDRLDDALAKNWNASAATAWRAQAKAKGPARLKAKLETKAMSDRISAAVAEAQADILKRLPSLVAIEGKKALAAVAQARDENLKKLPSLIAAQVKKAMAVEAKLREQRAAQKREEARKRRWYNKLLRVVGVKR